MTYKYMYQTPENFSNMIMNSDGEYLTGYGLKIQEILLNI